jgi:hypothetical protein
MPKYNSPPKFWHKGKAKWEAKTPEQQQVLIDRHNKKLADKEAFIKQRAAEAKAKAETQQSILVPFFPSDISNETKLIGSVDAEEEKKDESHITILPYKSYEHKMVQSEAVECDLDKAIKLRLQAMKDYRDGLF